MNENKKKRRGHVYTLPKSSNENPAYDMNINMIAYIQMLDAAK